MTGFEDGTHISELPSSDRRRRILSRTRDEAEKAGRTGRQFDQTADEVEIARDDYWSLAAGGIEPVDGIPPEEIQNLGKLESDLRRLLALENDVLDVGSFDASYIFKFGLDVCTRPEFLIVLKERAQRRTGKEKVLLDEIVDERRVLEIEMMHRESNIAAMAHLESLGISTDDLLDLYQRAPFELRSRSRFMTSPMLGSFVEKLKASADEGQTISLDEVIGQALTIALANNMIYEAMDRGDAEAARGFLRELKAPKMGEAIMEMAEVSDVLSRQPDIINPRFPNPEENTAPHLT